MGEHFSNGSDSEPILQIIFYIFIITVSIVVTLGNMLVILAMLVQKSLRTPPHLYLGSLALIDLSVGVFILPLRIVQVMNDHEWKFGASMCGIFVTADVTLCTLSIYHLIAIAADRYRAITHGIRYVQHRSFAMVTVTIAFLWVISLWISTPPALGWNDSDWGLQREGTENVEFCLMTRNKGYVFHSVLGSFIIPIVMIILLYYKIYVGIKAKLRKRARPVSMMGGKNIDIRDKSVGDTSDTYSSEDLLSQSEKLEEYPKGNKSATFPRRIKFRLTQLRGSILPSTISSGGSGSSSNNQGQDQIEGPTSSSDTPEDANASGPSTISGNDAKITTSILRKTVSLPAKSRPPSQVEEFVRKKIKFSLTKERRAVKTLGVIIGCFLICWVPFCILYLTDAFFFPVGDTVWFEITAWMGYVNSGMNPFIYTIFNRDFRAAFSKIVFFYKKS